MIFFQVYHNKNLNYSEIIIKNLKLLGVEDENQTTRFQINQKKISNNKKNIQINKKKIPSSLLSGTLHPCHGFNS